MTDEPKAKVHTAEAHVRSGGHAQGEDLARLLRWGQSRGAARVLDIATGGGHTALAFSGFTPTVVATDLSLPTVGAARKLIAGQGVAGVHFAAADVDALPFRAESFGVVTCRIAAHHFPELLPALRDELAAHKAQCREARDGLVFGTTSGRQQNPTNIRQRVLARAVERANKRRAVDSLVPLPERLTPHSLRRTFGGIAPVCAREDAA